MSHLVPMRSRLNIMFSRVLLVGVDHSLAIEVAHSAEAPQSAPLIPASVSALMSAMQIQSGPETSRAVSDHVALTITVANYSSFSTILIVRYRPPCITLQCKCLCNQL